MSSDCIERDLGGLIDEFKINIPSKNLDLKKQDSLNRLEQVWAFIDHQDKEPEYNLNLTKVSMNSKNKQAYQASPNVAVLF